MKQQAILFGKQNNLVGIYRFANKLTIEIGTKDVAFILWNTGVGTRNGHYRGNLELAEVIARSGYPSFRFDLSNRGDSDQRPSKAGEQERNTMDVREAMDELESQFNICLLYTSDAADE